MESVEQKTKNQFSFCIQNAFNDANSRLSLDLGLWTLVSRLNMLIACVVLNLVDIFLDVLLFTTRADEQYIFGVDHDVVF